MPNALVSHNYTQSKFNHNDYIQIYNDSINDTHFLFFSLCEIFVIGVGGGSMDVIQVKKYTSNSIFIRSIWIV